MRVSRGSSGSELGVKADDLLGAYRKIVASLYSTTAMAYRLNHGLREDDMVMCVGCLEVVDAMAGGVLYTRPPIGDDDGRLVINAVPGLPCSVVNGSSSVDIWVIDRDSLDICDTEVAEKELRYVQTSSGRVRRERLYGDMRFELPFQTRWQKSSQRQRCVLKSISSGRRTLNGRWIATDGFSYSNVVRCPSAV